METGSIRIHLKCLGCGAMRYGSASMSHGLSEFYQENRYCDRCGGTFFQIYHEASYGGSDGTSEVDRSDEYQARCLSYRQENPQYANPATLPRLPGTHESGPMFFYCVCGHQWQRTDWHHANHDHCPACGGEVPLRRCPICQEEITATLHELKYAKTPFVVHYRVDGKCRQEHGYLFGYRIEPVGSFRERRKNPW